MPGIVWGPGVGVPRGRISRALVSTMDVMPTVLDYLGTAIPPEIVVDGRSLKPLFDGTESDAVTADSRVLFHYCGYLLHAVRYGPWKAHFVIPRITDRTTSTCVYPIIPPIKGAVESGRVEEGEREGKRAIGTVSL